MLTLILDHPDDDDTAPLLSDEMDVAQADRVSLQASPDAGSRHKATSQPAQPLETEPWPFAASIQHST